jgi:ferredoxin
MPKQEYLRTKESSNISKIIIDRDLCIGVASCVTISPATYKLDDENKAVVIDANMASDEELILAAQSCPTKAIIIVDKDGKQIYP